MPHTPEASHSGQEIRRSATDLRARWCAVTAVVLLVVATVLYWAYTVHVGRSARLGVDEVFTTWMIQTPGIKHSLTLGADSEPPGFYWIVGGICKLFGYSYLSLRAIAMVGFFGFLVAVFFTVRRYANTTIAAIAAMLPLMTSAQTADLFARPHALMMTCFALLCLIWTSDESDTPPWRNAVAITLVLWLDLSVHFYSVIFVPVLLLMEAVWTVEHRRIRWRYWLATAAGMGILLAWLPVIVPVYKATHGSSKSAGYYAKPNLMAMLLRVREIVVSPGIMLIVVGIGAAAGALYLWRRWKGQTVAVQERHTGGRLPLLAYASFAIPLVTFAFAVLVTGVFNERYVWACVLGVSATTACLLKRLRLGPAWELAVLVFVVGLFARDVRMVFKTPQTADSPVDALISGAPGDGPVVVPGSNWYWIQGSPDARTRARATYVLAPPDAPDPDSEHGRIAAAWHTLRPELPITDAASFFATHPRFYLLTVGDPGEGMTAYIQAHYNTREIREEGTARLLEVERR